MSPTVLCRTCLYPFIYSKKHKVYCSTSCRNLGQKQAQHEWYRRRRPFVPKYCRVCSASIPEASPRFTLCSESCAQRAEQIRSKRRQIEDREKLRAQGRAWWEANKEKHRESNRKSQKKRLSKPGVAAREMSKYRTRKRRGKVFRFSERDVHRTLLRQSNKCLYCNCDLFPTSRHLDHVIPLSKGGSHGPGNLVFACPSCNASKGNKYLSVWRYKQRS